jgi:succinoglycan biosynthesis transport protein ExoP
MELRQYLYLLRKWFWLLLIGLVIGAVGAYYASTFQDYVYQTTTKVMVMRAPESSGTEATALNDFQLAKTYSQLFATEPVLQELSDQLGYRVHSNQISVRQVSDSLLLEITVKNGDPQRVAQIANKLVEVFIKYNEDLQTTRFAASEDSLKAQIDQVESQINTLQSEMSQATQQDLQSQQEDVQARITELQNQITPLKADIAGILPNPNDKEAEAALPQQLRLQLEEKRTKVASLQTALDLYQELYFNLSVFGQPNPDGQQTIRQDQLQGTLALYQQIYSNLLNSYESVRLARLRSTPNVVQIEQAPVPSSPIQPQPIRNALLGGATGIMIMGAIAFLIEYMDDTIKTPDDVARALDLPVIGLIGNMGLKNGDKNKIYVAEHPRSPISEAFRTLRTNLDFAAIGRPLRTILITSAAPTEGKTTVAVNLAAAMVQGERKVALVDADLRRPKIHGYFNIHNRSGLTDLIRQPNGYQGVVKSWGQSMVTIIPSGSLPPNPAELLGSERMNHILEKLEEKHDVVLVDSPPFIVTDPIILSAKVDGVILVIEPGKTRIDAAQAVLEQLQRAEARVLGVVLNPVSSKDAHYYGKYHYYTQDDGYFDA